MIDHYNAFISYKHAPLDNKVAEHVQSALEHFRIPGKIKKKTGVKRIERIFRDKDELPISSDLTETISHALANSDYLIVICTKSTALSHWVPREIEFFLQNHTKDQIYTVLAEGEPQEVIPEILCSDERVFTLGDGSSQTITVAMEPLSCDYRMSLWKADKEELPRLAAGMIGCSYDELMNRRRQYRKKRIIACASVVFALAAAFTGYLVHNQIKLKKAYDATLRSQSISLANQSEELLSNNERVEAIQVALASLPPETDGPVTGEGVRALIDASYAYWTLSSDNLPTVEWNYKMTSRVNQMRVSPKGKFFACTDYANNLKVWEAQKHTLIIDESFVKDTILDILFTRDDSLVVMCEKKVCFIHLPSKSVKWTYAEEEDVFRENILVSSDASSLFILSRRTNSSQKSELDYRTYDCILQLSCEDGSVLNSYEIGDGYYYKPRLSPDQKTIVLYTDEDDPTTDQIEDCITGARVLSLDSGEVFRVPFQMQNVSDLIWIGNTRFVVTGETEESTFLIDPFFVTVGAQSLVVSAYDISTREEIWTSALSYTEASLKTNLIYISTTNQIACSRGNVLCYYDCETGEMLNTIDFNREIVRFYDGSGQGNLVIFLKDGGTATVTSQHSDSVFISYKYDGPVSAVCGNSQGVFILQDLSSEVIFYGYSVFDTEWEAVTGSGFVNYPCGSAYFDDQYMVCLNWNLKEFDGKYGEEGLNIQIYDANERDLLAVLPQTDCKLDNHIRVLGIWNDVLYYACSEINENMDYSVFVHRYSIKKGKELEKVFLSSTTKDVQYVVSWSDHTITYIDKGISGDEKNIGIWDVQTDEKVSFKLPLECLSGRTAPQYFPLQNVIYYCDEQDDYVIDLDSGDVTEVKLPSKWERTVQVRSNEKGNRLAVTDKYHCAILDKNFEVLMSIPMEGRDVAGMTFCHPKGEKEMLLVAFRDGALNRYEVESGTLLGSTDFTTKVQGTLMAELTYYEEQDMLLICFDSWINLIDTESWLQMTVINHALGYHEKSDRFFVIQYGAERGRVGTFKHYSVEELVEKANEILGQEKMSEERKAIYGISDP